ncbi:BglG family transcription antiterminator [Paenibacillus camerounensis]|uniref:BglG family transcription antiterminator n=1 Tax=Paenibacillus camerounensis TaxID=1243663 RepID=UPI0005A854D1|nr:BglG family transcription antiterminator [Paenibacillus camerounensis]
MYPRLATILSYLIHAENPVTGEWLAGETRVTSRTVRNDIKLLNDMLTRNGAQVHTVRGAGYELRISDPFLFDGWSRQQITGAPPGSFVSPADRTTYIIRTLLLAKGYLKTEELADLLYVSTSTIQNDLKDVKAAIGTHGLELQKRPNYGLQISGREFPLRLCMFEAFKPFVNDAGTTSPGTNGLFTAEEVTQLRNLVISSMRRYDLAFSDTGLNSLVVHILIAAKRIREGHQISGLPDGFSALEHTQEAVAVLDLTSRLELDGITFPPAETAYLTMLLLGTERLPAAGNDIGRAVEAMDKEYYTYARDMIDEMEEALGLGIHADTELIWSLGMHLKPALNRIRMDMMIKNPMLESIKSAYPLAFQAGIIGAALLEKQTGLPISEHEIAYIALHIGAALERIKGRGLQKKCIIVCSSGLGSAQLLYQKLSKLTGSRLEVLGTFGSYNLSMAPLDQIDFIISTVPLALNPGIPVIVVHPLLNEGDWHSINSHMLSMNSTVAPFIRPELTFLKQSLDSRDEILAFLCSKLTGLQLAGANFLELVKQREAVSSTAYGNLTAIPHPLIPQTLETFWVICTLQKPVLWGNKRVQFVCLLCVSGKKKQDLTGMYNILIQVTESYELVQQLTSADSFQEISNIFFRNQTEKHSV